MLLGKRTLAVVPARSGSKGVPDKNMRAVGGLSMIARAARVLAQLPWLDARVISTDSAAYAAEAAAHGLPAPFMRPEHLSTDSAGAIETVEHALLECERANACTYDIVLIVEPSCPLRIPADVEACARALVEQKRDSVVAVSPVDSKFHPRKLLVAEGGAADRPAGAGHLRLYLKEGATVTARQQLEGGFVYRNGCAYALTRDCLMRQRQIFTENTGYMLVDRPVVNVDTEIEIQIADFLLRAGLASDGARG